MMTLSNIDISGRTAITVCFDIAEGDDGSSQDWDATDQVFIESSVDGGAIFTEITRIEAAGGTNTEPSFDCDGDGLGEGEPITSTFTTYCFPLDVTGTSLDFRIRIVNLNALDEDIAFDNIRLFGDGATLPAPNPCQDCPVMPATSMVTFDGCSGDDFEAVSYTHLTLPTIYSV